MICKIYNSKGRSLKSPGNPQKDRVLSALAYSLGVDSGTDGLAIDALLSVLAQKLKPESGQGACVRSRFSDAVSDAPYDATRFLEEIACGEYGLENALAAISLLRGLPSNFAAPAFAYICKFAAHEEARDGALWARDAAICGPDADAMSGPVVTSRGGFTNRKSVASIAQEFGSTELRGMLEGIKQDSEESFLAVSKFLNSPV